LPAGGIGFARLAGLAGLVLTGLARGSRLPTLALSGLTRLLPGFLARLAGAALAASRLGNLALQLIRQRIELRTRELQLLRIVAEHTLGGPLHATLEFVNLTLGPLARLPRLAARLRAADRW
jgi:hypothetical protein